MADHDDSIRPSVGGEANGDEALPLGELAQHLLQDGSLVPLAQRLSGALGCHVSVLDATLRPVASSQQVNERDLAVWLDFRAPLSSAREKPTGGMSSVVGPEGSRAVVVSISAATGLVGYMLLWPLTVSVAKMRKRLLDDVGGIVGLELARRRAVWRLEYRYQQDTIHELLAGRLGTPSDLRQRQEHLPWNLEAHYRVILFQLKPLFSEEPDEEMVLSMVEAVYRSLQGVAPAAIVAMIHSLLMLLVPEEGLMDKEMDLEVVARGVQHTLQPRSGGSKLDVGVSERAVSLLQLNKGFEEARDALELGRVLKGPGAISYFSRLGIYRLLRSAPRHLQQEFVDAIILPIEGHDRQRNALLMETLQEYVAVDGRVRLAAERLFVHVNTVKYRLRQIEELTGHSPYTVDGQLHLLLALKLRDLLGRPQS